MHVDDLASWPPISIQTFDELAMLDESPDLLVTSLILERLPFKFESHVQYFRWREELSHGLYIDQRDILVIGTSATGRSLSPRKKFDVFRNDRSDLDIAVVSQQAFETAWGWIRRADPVLLGFDEETRSSFEANKKH